MPSSPHDRNVQAAPCSSSVEGERERAANAAEEGRREAGGRMLECGITVLLRFTG